MIQDVLENHNDDDGDVSTLSIFDHVEALYDDLAESRTNTIKRAPQQPTTNYTPSASNQPQTQQQPQDGLDSASEDAEAVTKREPLLSPSRAINSYTYLYKQDANECDE